MRNSNATRTLQYYVFYITPNNGGFCPKEHSIRVQFHSSTSKSKPQLLSHILHTHSCSLPCSSWAIPAKKQVAVAAGGLSGAESALCGMRGEPTPLPAPCTPTACISITVTPGLVGWPATLRPVPSPRGHSCLAAHHSLMPWKTQKAC